MLATLPVAADLVRARVDWRRLHRQPVAISALATVLGAVIWIAVLPRVGTDLSAALARAGWAGHYPGSAYLFSWYGGMSPAGYSILAPYLLAALGTRLAMAIAAVTSAMLVTSMLVRHHVARPRAAALWVAGALWTELLAGRAAFTLGLAAAVACVLVADLTRRRSWIRLIAVGLLAVLTCLLSPVAALFLGVAAAVFVVARRWAEGLIIAGGAMLPLAAMIWFSDGGVQPVGWNWLPTLVAVAAVWWLIPRRWQIVRTGALIYGAGVIIICLVPTPVGSNVVRMGQLLIGPLLAGMGSSRRRWLLVLGLTGAAIWQVVQPITDLAHGSAPPAVALVRELGVLHADTARVEAVPLYGHWESQELASAVPLARGWERQLDVKRNPLFYDGTLTASTYHHWLQSNAVRYVALSASVPDTAAVTESAMIRAGQPWLVPVWHDAFWHLYRVTDADPLASAPAIIVSTTPAEITLRMIRAGSSIVRVHWSPLLQSPGAVLTPYGPWTELTARTPGRYVLSAPY